jgi:hypothetical protein
MATRHTKISPRSRLVQHIVRHVHWISGDLGTHECSTQRPARVRGLRPVTPARFLAPPSDTASQISQQVQTEKAQRTSSKARPPRPTIIRGVVVSTIATGSSSGVYYGSDNPTIRRQVDHLVPRIKRGECFSGGPLSFDGISRRIVRASRPAGSDLRRQSLLGELFFEVTTDRVRSDRGTTVFGQWLKGDPEAPETWITAPAPSPHMASLWDLYQQAAFAVVEAEFLSRCRCLRLLKSRSIRGDEIARRKLATLRELLQRHRRIVRGKSTPVYHSPIELVVDIAASLILRCHPKTLHRLVIHATPAGIYFR